MTACRMLNCPINSVTQLCSHCGFQAHRDPYEARDDAQTMVIALEAEIAHRQEGIDHAIQSIEADPCECEGTYDGLCERCLRIAWLTVPTKIEMDAMGQGAVHDPSTPDRSLDEILRSAS